MKKTSRFLAITTLITAAVICMNISGCEDDESVSNADDILGNFSSLDRENLSLSTLRITPASATVEFVGQKFSFTVDDGKGGFEWEVANAAAGTIEVTGNNGRTAVYTATLVADNDVVAIDSQGNAAVAQISISSAELKISGPDPLEIPGATNGVNVTLTAIGGTPPYSWSAVLPSVGEITSASGDTATYEVKIEDSTNTVILIDNKGADDSVTIVHK